MSSANDEADIMGVPEATLEADAPRLTEHLLEAAEEPGLRKGERTRRRVIWAAAIALEKESFAHLAMESIAEIAGVSRGALYQYVGSKEDAAREVLGRLQDLTLTMPRSGVFTRNPQEAISRTNYYYIDYYEKNAIFMERIHELRELLPDLIAARQLVNRKWADRVMAHVCRHRTTPMPDYVLRLRVVALECMIDDLMRELFIIRNPDVRALAENRQRFARELSNIWHSVLYTG